MDTKEWSAISFEEGRLILRKWREDNARRSEDCVEIWEHVLSRKPTALGDELWVVYEQVFIAAIDCARLDVAQECVQALHGKFPKSHRVAKLEAFRLEAIGKFEEALSLYNSLIDKDESNAIYRKRRVAILEAQGRTADAIRELSEYLDKFLNDNEGWLHLSELYLSIQDHNRAAYCLEELLISNPHNHLYHQRFAEIKYTQGGLDNIELAKSYYLQALELNAHSSRAMFGISQCCAQLLQHAKLTAQKRKEYTKLASAMSAQLLQRYTAASNMINAENNGIVVENGFGWVSSILKPVLHQNALSSN